MEDKFSEFFTWLDQQVGRAVWGVLEPDRYDESIQRRVTADGNSHTAAYLVAEHRDNDEIGPEHVDEFHITVRDNGHGIEFVSAMHVEEVRDPSDVLVPLISVRWIYNALEQAAFHSSDVHRIFYGIHQASKEKYPRLRDRRASAFNAVIQEPGRLVATLADFEVLSAMKHNTKDPRTLIDITYRESGAAEISLLVEAHLDGSVRLAKIGNSRIRHHKLSESYDNYHIVLSPDGPLMRRLKEVVPLYSAMDRIRRGLLESERAA